MSGTLISASTDGTISSAERDRWNACRFERGASTGHYESYYQRANHPDRPLGFWIRYTIFSPKGRPQDGIGELWAVWFDGERNQIVAVKEEHPIDECSFDSTRLKARIAQASIEEGSLEGEAARHDHRIAWNLTYGAAQPPLLMFPEPLYEKKFPKAKSLVGSPNAIFNGSITVDGERHEIDSWRGSQNHNWGSKHTDHYAFGQVAGFDNAPDSFIECSTARLKIGPFWTPFMTLIVLRHEGQTYPLNTIRQALRANGDIRYFDWTFASKTPEVEIRGHFSAPKAHFVALTYYNPPGGNKTCLNTKIASAEITLTRPGQTPLTLKVRHRALFEILTDDTAHGVPVLR